MTLMKGCRHHICFSTTHLMGVVGCRIDNLVLTLPQIPFGLSLAIVER